MTKHAREKINEEPLLEELNEEQLEAVTHGEGPLIIIAGAGTGKTKVITHRIAYLITSKKCRPDEILALTFTEKAANEMEERVDILVPYSYSYAHISTFNSFGESLLKEYSLELGFPANFKLMDEIEQAIFFRENLFNLPIKYFLPLGNPTKHIFDILEVIKRAKQEDITPEEYLGYAQKLRAESGEEDEVEEAEKQLEVAKIWIEYKKLLEKNGKIDFEDQIYLFVRLLEKRPSILAELQERWKYILVDEFQDTNYIQFKFLRMISEKNRNLTVVGDDDQAIYRFRGAAITNILNFLSFYPDAKKVILTRNYRSTQPILDTAYNLIKFNNPNRLEYKYEVLKRIIANKKNGKMVKFVQFDNFHTEAERVAEMIEEKIKEGVELHEIAILVRKNADAEPFLKALERRGIPFRFSGSRGLYSRDEVKVLISFLKSIANPEDNVSLFYLASSDIYQMNSEDIIKTSNYAKRKNIPLKQVFRKILNSEINIEISEEGMITIKKMLEDLDEFTKLAFKEKVDSILFSFVEKTQFLKKMSLNFHESLIKIKNIGKFFQKVRSFRESSENPSLFSFTDYLDLLIEMGDNPPTAEAELDEDAVNVLTVHKAKGLEFKVVFLGALVMDKFPGREIKEPIRIPDALIKEEIPTPVDKYEEERRLFYVGMTRAKDELYLTCARDYGGKREKKVSLFVLEALDMPKLPPELKKSTPEEEIYYSSPVSKSVVGEEKTSEILPLSFNQIDDYLTCPLKYKFIHVLKIPIPPHHTIVFGRAIHNAIHDYFRLKMIGKRISQDELLNFFKNYWVNDGFIDRRHEELRYEAGKSALRKFYEIEENSPYIPVYIEKTFSLKIDTVKLSGRYDRVDLRENGAVIIDFKSSEVKDEKTADKKAKENLQLSLYAYAFTKTYTHPLDETQLFFVESGIIGRAKKDEDDVEEALEKVKDVEEGIRNRIYNPKPDWLNCQYCPYQRYCPVY
ncbi:MAG: ATP-dependent DNA helicase [Acidobacteriota bacterium]